MRSDLLEYYETELRALRTMGAEFARTYPTIAERLQLDAKQSADPHVERLLQGFAFLAARVQLKIDDDFPEISEALLNGAQYPEILLTAQHIDTPTPGSQVRADVQITVRGQTHILSVPVTYSLANGQLTASGELPLKQSDLGLTPFTAMLGALAVQDEMKVRFNFVAHEATTHQR